MPTKAEQLGNYLRKQRESRKLSMNALAGAAKVDPATVMRLEEGDFSRPQPQTLARLARALQIDVEELYRRSPGLRPGGLPAFAPYLRAKLPRLPESQVKEVEDYFKQLEERYGVKGGRRGKRAR